MDNANLLTLLECFSLGFGGAAISGEGKGYGFGAISFEESIRLVDTAFDLGINLFDTAPIYGFGESERRLGQALKGKRDSVFLVNKGGITWDDNKRVDINNSVECLDKMLHQSLRDLQTDYLDLYFIHWPDARHSIEAAWEFLLKAKEQGKVRYLGLSNSNLEDIAKIEKLSTIDCLQGPLSLFDQSAVALYQAKSELPLMNYGTLDKGILTGRVNKDRRFAQEDCRSWAPWWKGMDKEWRYHAVAELQLFLQERGASLLQLALSYNFSFPFAQVALCGAKTGEDWEALIEAYDNLLDDQTLNEAIAIVEKYQQ